MAAYGPHAFSNDEKNFILAEIVKAASPNPAVLLEVVNRLNIQPRWEDISLPQGRSVNACRSAFDELRRGAIYSPMSQPGSISTPLSAPVPSLKRPTAGLDPPFSAGRAILPKTLGPPYAQAASSPPLKRKRGRPTKAEQQAKADAALSSAESSLGAQRQTPHMTSVPPSPSVDIRPAPTLPVSRVPISTIISTPTAPKSASQSSSSSGKRRRGRSMREEERPAPEQSRAPLRQYESPYARISRDPEDTPTAMAAAAAVLRYRDPPTISSSARQPPMAEPEQSPGARAGAAPETSPPTTSGGAS